MRRDGLANVSPDATHFVHPDHLFHSTRRACVIRHQLRRDSTFRWQTRTLKDFQAEGEKGRRVSPMPPPCPRAISVETSLAAPGPPLRHYLWYFLSREMKVLFKTGPRFKSHLLRDPPPTPPEASRKTKKSKVSIYSAQCNKNKQRQEVPFHWSRGCALDPLDHVSNISLTFQRDVTMVSFYRYGLQRSFDRNPEGKSFCYFLNFSPFPETKPPNYC